MDNFPNDEKRNETDFEESTIFSDPLEHTEKKQNGGGKKRLRNIIISLLAVALLAGSIFAVIKLIPLKEDETVDEGDFKAVPVLSLEEKQVKNVTITNQNGAFEFYNEQSEDSEGESQISWYLKNYDKEKTDKTEISTIVSGVISLEAIRQVDTKTAEECGLNSPKYKADIVTEDESLSVLFGDESPDGLGVYLMLSNSDKIYIADSGLTGGLEFTALSLANKTAIPAISTNDVAVKYRNDSDEIIGFDTITVSGKNFPKPVVIEMNDNDSTAAYAVYLTTAPTRRIAENVDVILALFAQDLAVTGAYSFEADEASIKAAGLNDPDFTATIKLGKTTRTFKFKKDSSGDYAVWCDGADMIKKVAASSLAFIDYETSDFYSSWVCLHSITDISNLVIKNGETVYDFGIKYDENSESDDQYDITLEGKKLTTTNFQEFYQYMVGLSCSDYTIDKVSGEPDLTLTFVYADKSVGEVKVEFFKSGATKYQYRQDGIDMGKITSSSYNKFIKYLEKVAKNESIK